MKKYLIIILINLLLASGIFILTDKNIEIINLSNLNKNMDQAINKMPEIDVDIQSTQKNINNVPEINFNNPFQFKEENLNLKTKKSNIINNVDDINNTDNINHANNTNNIKEEIENLNIKLQFIMQDYLNRFEPKAQILVGDKSKSFYINDVIKINDFELKINNITNQKLILNYQDKNIILKMGGLIFEGE